MTTPKRLFRPSHVALLILITGSVSIRAQEPRSLPFNCHGLVSRDNVMVHASGLCRSDISPEAIDQHPQPSLAAAMFDHEQGILDKRALMFIRDTAPQMLSHPDSASNLAEAMKKQLHGFCNRNGYQWKKRKASAPPTDDALDLAKSIAKIEGAVQATLTTMSWKDCAMEAFTIEEELDHICSAQKRKRGKV